MARQFKASTFFNKIIPSYYVQYTTDHDQKYHYSYEFKDSMVDPAIVDFCESRMLVNLYALISVYEQKIIVPSGKLVNLADFDKTSLHFLKMVDANYLNHSDWFARHSNDPLKLSSDYLNENITHDEFLKTDFYSDTLLKNEIILKASVIANYFYRMNKAIVHYILNFQLNLTPRFIELAEHFDILPKTAPVENVSSSVSDESDSEHPLEYEDLEELEIDFCLEDDTVFLEEKNSYAKKDLNNIIDYNNLSEFSKYSDEIVRDPLKLELFKILDIVTKKINSLRKHFDQMVNKLHVKSEYEMVKEQKINELAGNCKLYTDINVRADILQQMKDNYDLRDGIKLFSHYPYSSRQYEDQSYMPFMIKTPIKKVTKEIIDEIEKLVNDFPHFYEVINYIVLSLKVKLNTTGILSFKHILIVGNHGLGKNAFVTKLNMILGYIGNTINMTSILAPFELSGMDAGWNGSAPGFIFKALLKNNSANSLLILDDIDKVNNTHNGNVNTTIVDLLETASAKTYYENFFQTNLDMSHMTVIGLANTTDTIDKGLLNLFKVFMIDTPDVTSISSIVFSIYNELITDPIYSFIHVENHEINELAAKFIMTKVHSPRSIRKVIEDVLNDKLIEKVNKKELSFQAEHSKIDYSIDLLSKKEK